MKEILLYIWQLPQNLLGLLFLLFIRGEQKHSLGSIYFYYADSFLGGISLGQYIILGHETEKSIRHEYGHCLQSKILGPLYLLVIGLLSFSWAGLLRLKCVANKWSYYAFPTEKWANKLGGVER